MSPHGPEGLIERPLSLSFGILHWEPTAMQERLAFLSRSLVAPVVRNMPGKFSSPNAVAMLLATGWAMSQFGDRDGSWFHIPLPVAEDLLKNYIELSRQLELWGLKGMEPRAILAHSEIGAVLLARMVYYYDEWAASRQLPSLSVMECPKATEYFLNTWRPVEREAALERFAFAWPSAVQATVLTW